MKEDSNRKKKNDSAIINEAAQYHRARRLKTAGRVGANKGNQAVTMNVITGTLKFISGG